MYPRPADVIIEIAGRRRQELSGNPILWTPTRGRIEKSAMFRFMTEQGHASYDELYRWSVADVEAFWQALCDFCNIEFTTPAETVLDQPGDMTTARWFVGSELSFPAHLLRSSGERAAIIFRGEDGARRELSFDELRAQVAAVAAGLKSAGVTKGDRVAGFLPNCPQAIIAMLAATSIGAIWSSCSPDFGINGVVDRFGQIEPKVLFCADGYFYNGKRIDSLDAVAGVVKLIDSITHTVVVPFTDDAVTLPDLDGAVLWQDFTEAGRKLEFTSVPFDHPLYIMYSSGTTGVPKCIVHSVGGTLLQHQKEHVLHCDIGPQDRLFYFTTCGWMMWNWLASGLACGTTLILYDGSPFYDDGRILWRMAQEEKISIFGTSAKFIAAQEKAGIRPGEEFDLSSIRTIFSTGSTLMPESFDFVYDAIGDDLQLSSVSGGTDILSCFVGGNPMKPVYRGELQSLALAMKVEIFSSDGRSVIGEKGELVCTNSFPSMPVGFWNDPGDRKYHAAYFERFPGVWAQGDFAEITDNGGMIIHGRSDAVLNPGGVRIGTAEIYRQVEKLDEILESIAIGQNWDGDVRVVLFVVLRQGLVLDDDLELRIRKLIRKNTTPRHVPAKIIAVPEIPRTISGKIVELAVRSVVHGEAVGNMDALANPAALDHFRGLPELAVE
ncbi:MAG: acetoacetate--CoA ligase [Proteobacteria bacterium]|nr:acetoacetate--CoA ligase [Pseudomonadota bacterium]